MQKQNQFIYYLKEKMIAGVNFWETIRPEGDAGNYYSSDEIMETILNMFCWNVTGFNQVFDQEFVKEQVRIYYLYYTDTMSEEFQRKREYQNKMQRKQIKHEEAYMQMSIDA